MNLSVVIPVYNERDSLPMLYDAVVQALAPLSHSWELILIDDGSRDDSFDVLAELARCDPDHVRVIRLRRNFGQTAAIAAGIDHADGEVIVLMDADMQNDPADIPMMLAKLEEGYDVVNGWRINRQDTFLTRKVPSAMANWLIATVTGVRLHDYGCTLKAMRSEVIQGFRLYGEMHRFIPVYANSVGARMIEMPVHHHPRRFGKAKYGLERTMKVILDLFTVKFLSSYSSKPIYLFGGTGFGLMAISGFLLLYLAARRLALGTSVLASPLFTTSLMVFVLGFQSILMGLIAEMLMRTYHESQGKPTYIVRDKINVNHDSILERRFV